MSVMLLIRELLYLMLETDSDWSLAACLSVTCGTWPINLAHWTQLACGHGV